MPKTRRRTSPLANATPSRAGPAGPPASLSENISLLLDTHGGLDWPHEVVRAMQMLKAHADRLQALIDAASTSGSRIGDLAARMDAASGSEPVRAGEARSGAACPERV
jgi:hypothetical protein